MVEAEDLCGAVSGDEWWKFGPQATPDLYVSFQGSISSASTPASTIAIGTEDRNWIHWTMVSVTVYVQVSSSDDGSSSSDSTMGQIALQLLWTGMRTEIAPTKYLTLSDRYHRPIETTGSTRLFF